MVIPEEIKEAVSSLDYDLRWRLIELIQEKEELSYTELLRKLRVKKGSLSHHLNRLMEGGILDNFSKKEFGGPYTSYYKLSQFGRDFLDGLLSSVEFGLFLQPYERRARRPVRKYYLESAKQYAAYLSKKPLKKGFCASLSKPMMEKAVYGFLRGSTVDKYEKSNKQRVFFVPSK